MNYNEVKSKIFSILEDKLGVDMDDLTENSSYSNDLGVDSLDAVELLMTFESNFEIVVEDEEFEMFTRNSTIKQSIDFICKKLNISILNEQKMKVKCINQNNYRDITAGNEYEVVEILENLYHITADSGNIRSYNKKYFELIPELAIEDVDEVGVIEEEIVVVDVEYVNTNGVKMLIDEYEVLLSYSNVAGNCGVYSYSGVNYLFEMCKHNKELFKRCILMIIEEFQDSGNGCMLIFSTNEDYTEIWEVLDEIMDLGTDTLNNPNSDMDVKLWVKYAYHDKNDGEEGEEW